MTRCFDPHEFVQLLESGALDFHLHEELQRLSKDQLEQVAQMVIARHGNSRAVLEQG